MTVPALPACVTEGDTREEALANAQEAITCYLEGLIADGEPIPPEDAVEITTVAVSAPR